MTDPRNTQQHRAQELRAVHTILEEVAIVLDPDRSSSRLERGFRDDADWRGITLNAQLALEVQEAMNRIANWIPCRPEAVPQCECDCPDCDPED